MTDIDNNILCLQAQLAEDEQDSQDSGSLHWNEDNSRELIKSFQSAYSIEIHSMRSFMGALNYGFPDLTQDRVGLRDEDPLNSLLPSGTGPVRVSGQPVSGLRQRPLDTEQRDQGEMESQQRGIKRSELSQAPVPEKKSKTLSYKNDEEKENFTVTEKDNENFPLKEENEENFTLKEKDRSGPRQPFMDLTNARTESITKEVFPAAGESKSNAHDAVEEDPTDINAIFSIRAMFSSLKNVQHYQHKSLRF